MQWLAVRLGRRPGGEAGAVGTLCAQPQALPALLFAGWCRAGVPACALGHWDTPTHTCAHAHAHTHTHGEGAGVDLVPGAGASTVAQQGRVCGIFLASSSVLPQTHLPTINYITQSSN